MKNSVTSSTALEDTKESINSSHQAAAIRSNFRPYYNMGLAYIAQKDWAEANFAFERAITHCEQDSWNEYYSNAYYYWGLSLARMGGAETAIKDLEESLKISPEMTYGRFELATLYLGSGKYKEAMAQYRILKIVDPILANELLKLIKKISQIGVIVESSSPATETYNIEGKVLATFQSIIFRSHLMALD